METIIKLIIELVAGAIGGNAVGAGAKQYSLGTTGNSVAGAIGGVVLGQLISAFGGGGEMAGGLSLGTIVTQLIGGGAGGAILTFIVGLIRSMSKG